MASIETRRLIGCPPDRTVGLTKLLILNLKFKPPTFASMARDSYMQQQRSEHVSTSGFKESDYGWLPPWGLITEATIANLTSSNVQEFVMKDRSKVLFRRVEDMALLYQQHAFTWVTENPGLFVYFNILTLVGSQLFTGSFHPVEDSKWEDRRNWDITAVAKEPLTLVDIFNFKIQIRIKTFLQKTIRVCTLKTSTNSLKILSKALQVLPEDIIREIISRLTWNDRYNLVQTCKCDLPEKPIPPFSQRYHLKSVPNTMPNLLLEYDLYPIL
jgi:hypothetical protein